MNRAAIQARRIHTTRTSMSRSGFYSCHSRLSGERRFSYVAPTSRIETIQEASKQACGALRIHVELADDGFHVGRRRIEQLIMAKGLTPHRGFGAVQSTLSATRPFWSKRVTVNPGAPSVTTTRSNAPNRSATAAGLGTRISQVPSLVNCGR